MCWVRRGWEAWGGWVGGRACEGRVGGGGCAKREGRACGDYVGREGACLVLCLRPFELPGCPLGWTPPPCTPTPPPPLANPPPPVGAGNTEGGLDFANMLKPALARGGLQVVGATTLDEYRGRIESDPALARRFQVGEAGATGKVVVGVRRGGRVWRERSVAAQGEGREGQERPGVLGTWLLEGSERPGCLGVHGVACRSLERTKVDPRRYS
jgi:hypothetical protein